MSIKQYRIRLLEIRKKINELIETELTLLDDEEIRQAKEINGRPPVNNVSQGGPERA